MSTPRLAAYRSTARLALIDILHEWRVSFCLILALAAVLAPLLVLFGLKSGIVTTMRDRLLSDPRTLEVVVVGSYRLDPAWFASLANNPAVGFAIPRTRSLAATIDLQAAEGRSLAGAELVPTASGDPLLTGQAPPNGRDQVILSHSAAQKLAVSPGSQITALVARTLNGGRQVQRLPLTVGAVLPEASFGRDGAFVSLETLAAVEDFRDGHDTPQPLQSRTFASLRLFAASLDAVQGLADQLRAQSIEVRTKADEIAMVKAVDKTLGSLFAIIASLAIGGYLLSLAASLWANVDRKRKDLALMRLVGFPPGAVMAFPVVQAALIAVIGTSLSAALAGGVAWIVNTMLANTLSQEEFACLLLPGDIAVALAVTVVLALLASSLGGYRAARIDPAESLREI